MQKTVRILSLLLIAVLSLSLLASCGGGGDDDTTTASGGSGDGKWANISYAGKTLKVEYNNVTQPAIETAGTNNSTKFIIGPDQYSSGAVDRALWERNVEVTSMLGCDIQYSTDDSDTTGFVSHYEALMTAGDAPSVIISQNYGLMRAMNLGYLYNLKENYGTEKNHFAFEGEDASGWYMDIMKSSTLSSDKLYLAAGDFLMDSLRMSYVTFVNASMFDEKFGYLDASGKGMNYLYDLILNPSTEDASLAWSYDTMKTLADLAYEPNPMDEDSIVYGLLANNLSYRAFFFSSGLDIFTYDSNGTPYYVEDISALHQYNDDLADLLGKKCEYLPRLGGPKATAPASLEIFQDGRSLFMSDQFLCTLDGANFRSMSDNVAAIPYPKYDLSGGYKILVSDNANSGAILLSASDEQFEMSSAYLQMMTEKSSGVVRQYFEIGMKYKDNMADDPRQVEVFDLIRAGLCEPLAFLYDNLVSREISDPGNEFSLGALDTAATIYDLFRHTIEKDTNQFASGWARNIVAKKSKLASIVAAFQSR